MLLRLGAELTLPVAFYGIDAPMHDLGGIAGGPSVRAYEDLAHETTVDLELRLTAGVRF
jgi:hypothetical protein